tara:strand:+ start:17823 stop:18074 length:252 start_codon:yes stop_codon:yes gene_type:complete
MKSKFLKVILPAFAIMLALGLSSFTVNDVSQTAYYQDSVLGPQTTQTDCQNLTQIPCTIIDQGEQEVILYQDVERTIPFTKPE